MRRLLFLLLAGSGILSLASCEKVIDLKLGDSTPQLVVEGELTDDSSQLFRVRLSKSVLFGDQNVFPPVTGAKVWVTDVTTGKTDTLSGGGLQNTYVAPVLGQQGHRYNLTIVTPEDGTFTATSTMPQKVPFDSLYLQTASFFGQKGGQVFPVYTDPAGITNYYRFQVYIRGRLEAGSTRDDRLSDGRVNGRPIGFGIEDSVKTGDPVLVQMQCIDESAFKYFSTLGQSDGNSAAPANPASNISGGALGYFSAHTVSYKAVPIP